MKVILWIIVIVILLALFINILTTPVAWIGILIALFGYYQIRQRNKGKVTFSRPGWIVTAGILLSIILGVAFGDAEEDIVEEKEVARQEEKAVNEKLDDTEIVKENEESTQQLETEENTSDDAQAKQQVGIASELGLVAATVSRVTDGDTIVTSDGSKIRLIGVNTPESTTRTEEYGKEASNYTTTKLNGKQIWLQKDVSETDRYGRLLRIVWLEIPSDDMEENEIRTKMFNADLVLNGYAEPSTFPPDVKYSEYFVKFAKEAREQNKGLWAFGENGTTKGDLDVKEDTPPPSQAPAKSAGETENFANCTELRTKYPNGVPSDHPAYQSKMDRDKDNYACEQ